LEETDKVVSELIEGFKKRGIANAGEPIVVVHGSSARAGATNTMRIQYA
jgi:pyruvate kinase